MNLNWETRQGTQFKISYVNRKTNRNKIYQYLAQYMFKQHIFSRSFELVMTFEFDPYLPLRANHLY